MSKEIYSLIGWPAAMPAIPTKQPPLMQLLSQTTDAERLWPSIWFATITALGARLGHTNVPLYTGEAQTAALQHFTVANPASGKGFKTTLVEAICQDLQAEDNRADALREQHKRRQSALRTKGELPEAEERRARFTKNLIPYNSSQASIVERARDNQGLGMLLLTSEAERLHGFHLTGERPNPSHIVIDAFDSAACSSDRQTESGVTGTARLHLSIDTSITPAGIRRFFQGQENKGAISRLLLSSIEDDWTASRPRNTMPIDFDANIAAYIAPIEQIRREILQGRQQLTLRSDDVDRFISSLDEELARIWRPQRLVSLAEWCKRDVNITHRMAMILWLAHNREWTPQIEEWCHWAAWYNLYVKLAFFGYIIQNELDGNTMTRIAAPTIYDQLPDTFTRDELYKVYEERGSKRESADRWLREAINREQTLTFDKDTGKFHKNKA